MNNLNKSKKEKEDYAGDLEDLDDIDSRVDDIWALKVRRMAGLPEYEYMGGIIPTQKSGESDNWNDQDLKIIDTWIDVEDAAEFDLSPTILKYRGFVVPMMHVSRTVDYLWDLINDQVQGYSSKIASEDRTRLIEEIRQILAKVDAAKQETQPVHIQVGQSLAQLGVVQSDKHLEDHGSAWIGPAKIYQSVIEFLIEKGYLPAKKKDVFKKEMVQIDLGLDETHLYIYITDDNKVKPAAKK